MGSIEIVDVTPSNVDQCGFFCAMSKPNSIGYQEKLAWTRERFREGLRIKMLAKGGRGFIEYIPGRFAWRGIDAPGYMVIHCLWVVGRSRTRGSGKALLDACIRDARSAGMHGVAAVTANEKVGLVDTDFFLHHGFHVVQSTPSGIDLVVLKFQPESADPCFIADLKKKGKALAGGLTVISSPQCPFTYEGAQRIVALADTDRIPVRSLRVSSLKQLRQSSPSPYASFDIVYNGEVVSHQCQCLTPKHLRKLLSPDGSRPASN